MSETTASDPHPSERRIRKALGVLAAAAVAAAPLVAGAPHVVARIALNHNETPATDRRTSAGRPSGRGVRTALTALALSAAATVPAAALTATPAHAIGSCGTWSCGANHNETPGKDRRA